MQVCTMILTTSSTVVILHDCIMKMKCEVCKLVWCSKLHHGHTNDTISSFRSHLTSFGHGCVCMGGLVLPLIFCVNQLDLWPLFKVILETLSLITFWRLYDARWTNVFLHCQHFVGKWLYVLAKNSVRFHLVLF